ncbi:MAG: hypothetical protein EBU90_15750 [Proteobacteria bacterium]|nr:hypothetical protein [Pseudomonadota bacterium]
MNLNKLIILASQHQQSLLWAYQESDIIANKIIELEKQKKFDVEMYNSLSNKLLELQMRYLREKKEYEATNKSIKHYFKAKYDIDIVGILENDIDIAK